MLKFAIPLLHISDSLAAEAYYCGRLGFTLDFAHRADHPDPCYMGVHRDGVQLHLSSLSGDGVPGSVVNFVVDDVNALHKEFLAKNVVIAVGPVDQTWGNREIYVKDADGNSLRFMQPL